MLGTTPALLVRLRQGPATGQDRLPVGRQENKFCAQLLSLACDVISWTNPARGGSGLKEVLEVFAIAVRWLPAFALEPFSPRLSKSATVFFGEYLSLVLEGSHKRRLSWPQFGRDCRGG